MVGRKVQRESNGTQMAQTIARRMNGHKYFLCWILFQGKKWGIKASEFNFPHIVSKVLLGNQGTQTAQTNARRMNGHKYLKRQLYFLFVLLNI
jgi:hypothetical protein